MTSSAEWSEVANRALAVAAFSRTAASRPAKLGNGR